MRDDPFFSSVSENRTVSLLLALGSADRPLNLKEMQHITNHSQTLRSRVDSMEEDGLVDINIVFEPNKNVMVSLTDTGKDAYAVFSVIDGFVAPSKATRDKSIDMKYVDPILRMLLGKEYLFQADILEMIPIYRSVVKALDALEKDGLVKSRISTEGRKTVRYSLTDAGIRVAEAFRFVYGKIVSNRS